MWVKFDTRLLFDYPRNVKFNALMWVKFNKIKGKSEI